MASVSEAIYLTHKGGCFAPSGGAQPHPFVVMASTFALLSVNSAKPSLSPNCHGEHVHCTQYKLREAISLIHLEDGFTEVLRHHCCGIFRRSKWLPHC